MNAKNALNATNANKKADEPYAFDPNARRLALGAAVTALFGLLLLPQQAKAYEGSAPAMSGVQELLVQGIRLGNETTVNACHVKIEAIGSALVKALKESGVPAVSAMESKPPRIGVARVQVLPEIISSSTQGMECTSWLSLSVQSENTLPIPPIDIPRNVTITYWRGGLLLHSVVPAHQQALIDAFDKLARALARQYSMDQPPPLPNLDKEED